MGVGCEHGYEPIACRDCRRSVDINVNVRVDEQKSESQKLSTRKIIVVADSQQRARFIAGELGVLPFSLCSRVDELRGLSYPLVILDYEYGNQIELKKINEELDCCRATVLVFRPMSHLRD